MTLPEMKKQLREELAAAERRFQRDDNVEDMHLVDEIAFALGVLEAIDCE